MCNDPAVLLDVTKSEAGVLNLQQADVFFAARVFFFNIVSSCMMESSYSIAENTPC
jgi:hypothetical protein